MKKDDIKQFGGSALLKAAQFLFYKWDGSPTAEAMDFNVSSTCVDWKNFPESA